MIETGGGQFRTSTGRCVTNSVTRAIFATDRGQECIRTGRCGAMKRITGTWGSLMKLADRNLAGRKCVLIRWL